MYRSQAGPRLVLGFGCLSFTLRGGGPGSLTYLCLGVRGGEVSPTAAYSGGVSEWVVVFWVGVVGELWWRSS